VPHEREFARDVSDVHGYVAAWKWLGSRSRPKWHSRASQPSQLLLWRTDPSWHRGTERLP